MAVQTKNPDVAQAGNATGSEPVIEETAGAGHVDKIRDILFGNQMRDYERNFSRLEDRIMKEVTQLRGEFNKRFDALEGYTNREIESLSGRLKTEQSNRTEAEKALADELTKNTRLLEKKLADLDNQLGNSTRDLRQQILDQSKMLSEEIGRKYDETGKALDRAAGELREEKVDRSALSGLLTELALRLAEDSMLDLDLDKEAG